MIRIRKRDQKDSMVQGRRSHKEYILEYDSQGNNVKSTYYDEEDNQTYHGDNRVWRRRPPLCHDNAYDSDSQMEKILYDL